MGTVMTGLIVARWEIMSTFMMFIASSLNVKFRKKGHRIIAFAFSGIGFATACWLVLTLSGNTINTAGMSHLWAVAKDVFVDVMSQPSAYSMM